MNLVKEPWIPVVMQDGKPARVSLRMRLQKGRHCRSGCKPMPAYRADASLDLRPKPRYPKDEGGLARM